MGPDGLHSLRLKLLGPLGVSYLTSLFNLYVNHADILSIWKRQSLSAIHKPVEKEPSCRPICSLSPGDKVLERLILPFLTYSLPLVPCQHGFRRQRSMTTATTAVATWPPGSQSAQPAQARPPHLHRLSLLHPRLLSNPPRNPTRPDRRQPPPPQPHPLADHLRRWPPRILPLWLRRLPLPPCVPQGSAISSVLFNFSVSDFTHNNAQTISYADDFTSAAANPNVQEIALALSAHASSAAENKGLQISLSKNNVTLFTPGTLQFNLRPDVSLDNHALPLENNPKITHSTATSPSPTTLKALLAVPHPASTYWRR